MKSLRAWIKNFPRNIFDEGNRTVKISLYSFLILSFIFKFILLIINSDSWIKGDSLGYIEMAKAILSGEPVSSFPNGYPLILTLFMILTGSHYAISAVLLSWFLSCLSAIIVFLIVRNIAGSNAGLLAAVMTSWLPNQIFYANDLLTEAPSTFFLITGFYFIFKKKGFYAGIAIAAGVWLRTSFLPVLLAAPFFALTDKPERRLFYLAYLAGAATPLLADTVLNFTGVTAAASNLNLNLLLAVNKRSSDSSFFINNFFSPDQLKNPLKYYFRFMTENPGEYIIQRFIALWEMWFYSLKDNFDSVAVKLVKLTRTPFFLISVFGIIKYFSDKYIRLLFLPVFCITMVHFFFFGDDRFSFYAEPFTIMITVLIFSKYYPVKATI